eukprot:TRINITY_DN2419_c0_g1_i2.p1 TRINITY_DN2419_c0_g1~~TRINITY_DN2419_c0_g1_i2.p1  ORF type:complete len:674 (-),score=233.95 TRINITY_DN2419_c0_g1_i2:13-2034(-)
MSKKEKGTKKVGDWFCSNCFTQNESFHDICMNCNEEKNHSSVVKYASNTNPLSTSAKLKKSLPKVQPKVEIQKTIRCKIDWIYCNGACGDYDFDTTSNSLEDLSVYNDFGTEYKPKNFVCNLNIVYDDDWRKKLDEQLVSIGMLSEVAVHNVCDNIIRKTHKENKRLKREIKITEKQKVYSERERRRALNPPLPPSAFGPRRFNLRIDDDEIPYKLYPSSNKKSLSKFEFVTNDNFTTKENYRVVNYQYPEGMMTKSSNDRQRPSKPPTSQGSVNNSNYDDDLRRAIELSKKSENIKTKEDMELEWALKLSEKQYQNEQQHTKQQQSKSILEDLTEEEQLKLALQLSEMDANESDHPNNISSSIVDVVDGDEDNQNKQDKYWDYFDDDYVPEVEDLFTERKLEHQYFHSMNYGEDDDDDDDYYYDEDEDDLQQYVHNESRTLSLSQFIESPILSPAPSLASSSSNIPKSTTADDVETSLSKSSSSLSKSKDNTSSSSSSSLSTTSSQKSSLSSSGKIKSTVSKNGMYTYDDDDDDDVDYFDYFDEEDDYYNDEDDYYESKGTTTKKTGTTTTTTTAAKPQQSNVKNNTNTKINNTNTTNNNNSKPKQNNSKSNESWPSLPSKPAPSTTTASNSSQSNWARKPNNKNKNNNNNKPVNTTASPSKLPTQRLSKKS